MKANIEVSGSSCCILRQVFPNSMDRKRVTKKAPRDALFILILTILAATATSGEKGEMSLMQSIGGVADYLLIYDRPAFLFY